MTWPGDLTRDSAGPDGGFAGPDGGFTLLEVLVAFAIAALALAALTQGAAGGLQSARVAGHVQEALSRARSHLAAAALAPVAGEQQGDDGGGFAWQATTAPVQTAAPGREGVDPPRIGRAVLYAVRVRVSWSLDGGLREVVLTTQALGVAPP